MELLSVFTATPFFLIVNSELLVASAEKVTVLPGFIAPDEEVDANLTLNSPAGITGMKKSFPVASLPSFVPPGPSLKTKDNS